MLVFGLGIGWFVPNLMTALSRRVSEKRQGRAVGIVKAAHYLASPLAVLAVEPIARAFGARSAMMASAVASLTVVAISLLKAVRRSSLPIPAAGAPGTGAHH